MSQIDIFGGLRGELLKRCVPGADYTVKPTASAANLFLLSRASSDAYKTYTGLMGYGQESLTPGGASEMLTLKPHHATCTARATRLQAVDRSRPPPPHLSTSEFPLHLLELSSPRRAEHLVLSMCGSTSKSCIEGKGSIHSIRRYT